MLTGNESRKRRSWSAAGVALARRVGQNLFWGVRWGLALAVFFCLVGVALYVARGPRLLAPYGITLGELMLVYLAGGTAAGTVVGLARPLLRWRIGAIAAGILGALLVYGAAGIALTGPVTRWRTENWIVEIVLGIIGGSVAGNSLWERYVEPNLWRQKHASR